MSIVTEEDFSKQPQILSTKKPDAREAYSSKADGLNNNKLNPGTQRSNQLTAAAVNVM